MRGFDVLAAGPGGHGTIARLRQPRDPGQRVRPPFEIRTGADQPVALIGGTGAVGAFTVAQPDGTVVGTIRVNRSLWELRQPQAPVVIGADHGLAGMLRRLDQYLTTGVFLVLPYRMEFTVDGQAAFSLRRAAGPGHRFSIDVHQPWLDRRLILAQVLALSRFH